MTDWDGEGYEQISDLQRWLAGRAVALLRLHGDERVLDVGCGDGYVSRLLATRVPSGELVGIDASPRMIEVARSRPGPTDSRLRFDVGDVLELNLEDEFDLVVSFNTLHWVIDQRAALVQLAGAVRGSGRVVVQVVCAGPRPSLERIAMQVCKAARWRAAFAGFPAPFVHVDPTAYRGLVASAGLAVSRLTVDDLEWDFGSREAFARWCTVGFADWTARLPAADVLAGVDDVVTEYQALVGRPGLFRFMQMHADMQRSAPAGG